MVARIYHIEPQAVHRAAACDITGGMASLNFDATELQIFKDNIETQIYSMEILRRTIKNVQSLVLKYGVLWRMARSCHAP